MKTVNQAELTDQTRTVVLELSVDEESALRRILKREVDSQRRKKTTKKETPLDPVDVELVRFLFDSIKKNNPRAQTPNERKWCEEIQKIRRRNYSVQEIKSVIVWCQEHPFWQSNILSAGSLREKFDRLLLQKGQQVRADEKNFRGRKPFERAPRQIETVNDLKAQFKKR